MNNKVVSSLREAIELSGLKSGMTVSFHHHLRNGDFVLNMVMADSVRFSEISEDAASLCFRYPTIASARCVSSARSLSHMS